MRRGGARKRRDATEAEIVDGLRQLGAYVVRCHGDGAPDLIVWWRSRWLPIEVKSKGGAIRPNQIQYPVARTLEQALALFHL